MNWHIILRGLFLSIPRFLVLTVLMTLYAWIDWSPLPEKPLLLTVTFLTHFLVTYLFARWAYGKYLPHWKDAVIVFFTWLIVQVCCEAWYQAIRTGGKFTELVTSYNWWSLLTVALYITAMWLAYERNHAKYHPDAMEMPL